MRSAHCSTFRVRPCSCFPAYSSTSPFGAGRRSPCERSGRPRVLANEYAGYSDSFRGEAVRRPGTRSAGPHRAEPAQHVAQPSSTVTFRRLMDEGAIVICDLRKTAWAKAPLTFSAHSSPPRLRKPHCHAPTPPPVIAACSIFMPMSFSHSPRRASRSFSRRPASTRYSYDRPPISRPAPRPAALRGVRQRRIDHLLPRRCRGCRDPLQANRFGRSRCASRSS